MAFHDHTTTPGLVSLTKTFVLSVLISAAIAKLGEAFFNQYTISVEPYEFLTPFRAAEGLFRVYTISVFLFIIYFLLVIGRHLGATYALSMLPGGLDRKVWNSSQKVRALLVVEFIATFLMFLLHYVVAFGLSEAVQGGNDWPIRVVLFLIIALAIDIVICIVGLATIRAFKSASGSLAEDELAAIDRLYWDNRCWALVSSGEIIALIATLVIASSSRGIVIPLLCAIAIAVIDIVLTSGYWARLVSSD